MYKRYRCHSSNKKSIGKIPSKFINMSNLTMNDKSRPISSSNYTVNVMRQPKQIIQTQIRLRSSLIRFYTLCHFRLMYICFVKLNCSNFRTITVLVRCPTCSIFMVHTLSNCHCERCGTSVRWRATIDRIYLKIIVRRCHRQLIYYCYLTSR